MLLQRNNRLHFIRKRGLVRSSSFEHEVTRESDKYSWRTCVRDLESAIVMAKRSRCFEKSWQFGSSSSAGVEAKAFTRPRHEDNFDFNLRNANILFRMYRGKFSSMRPFTNCFTCCSKSWGTVFTCEFNACLPCIFCFPFCCSWITVDEVPSSHYLSVASQTVYLLRLTATTWFVLDEKYCKKQLRNKTKAEKYKHAPKLW